MNLALFDFDGTITNKDSLIEFVKYTKGKYSLAKGVVRILPIILLNKIGIIDAQTLKESFLKYFFANIEETKFKTIAEEFSTNIIPLIIKKKALERIKWHKNNADKIVIVSASLECLLKPWCEKNNIDLIATKLKFIENRFTGKLLTKNCKGQEKVNRIKQFLRLEDYNKIYVYGDSNGDRQMMELGNERYYKVF